MKILIVDDSSTMRRIIMNTLKRLCYDDLIEAEDGSDALKKFNANPDVAVVITDWNMPIMNGLDLVKKIREQTQDIPIIMVTTEGGKAEVISALRAGVNNYIIKPFTPQILSDKLKDLLS